MSVYIRSKHQPIMIALLPINKHALHGNNIRWLTYPFEQLKTYLQDIK